MVIYVIKKFLKGIALFFIGGILINSAFIIGTTGSIFTSAVSDSLDKNEITWTDFFSNDVSEEKKKMLQNRVNAKGSEMGREFASSFISTLSFLLPESARNDVKTPSSQPHKQPSIDEVLALMEAKAEEGKEQGMSIIQNNDK